MPGCYVPSHGVLGWPLYAEFGPFILYLQFFLCQTFCSPLPHLRLSEKDLMRRMKKIPRGGSHNVADSSNFANMGGALLHPTPLFKYSLKKRRVVSQLGLA